MRVMMTFLLMAGTAMAGDLAPRYEDLECPAYSWARQVKGGWQCEAPGEQSRGYLVEHYPRHVPMPFVPMPRDWTDARAWERYRRQVERAQWAQAEAQRAEDLNTIFRNLLLEVARER